MIALRLPAGLGKEGFYWGCMGRGRGKLGWSAGAPYRLREGPTSLSGANDQNRSDGTRRQNSKFCARPQRHSIAT
jgi:hypothetical protein